MIGLLVTPRISLGSAGKKRQALVVEFPDLQDEEVLASEGIHRLQFARSVKPALRLRLDLSQKGRSTKDPLSRGIKSP